MERYDYKGGVHLHSTYSDGKGNIEEIMAGANEAGLDFVILTDHNQVTAATDGHEKWHGSSLLMVGAEISPPDNHYIAWGTGALDGLESLREKEPQAYIDAVRDAEWVGFLAHPDYLGTKNVGGGSFRWTDESARGFTGLSIWSLLDDWRRQVRLENVTPAQVYTEFPKHIQGPAEASFKRWDALLREGRYVGIGELDNHKMTRKYGEEEFVVFPYEKAFRTITNHVLLEEPLSKDPAKAKGQIVEAFRRGNLYVSFDYHDDPSDFSMAVEHDEGTAIQGDEFKSGDEDELWVSLPADAGIRLIKDGEVIEEAHNFELVTRLKGPGVYRIEVRKDNAPWIFSNPIYAK